MTDLTEQWKKGELPSGKYYYISTTYYPEIIQNYVDGFYDLEDDEIEQILDKVPSYKEWQAKLKENAQLKEKIERLEKQYDRAKWWLNEIVNNHRFTPISTAEKALKDLSELEK